MVATNDKRGTGRRKTASASVILRPGQQGIVVNKKEFETYFPTEFLQKKALEPLELMGMVDKFRVIANVRGGGHEAQAEAVRLGIARALVSEDEARREKLKEKGFLRRDPRKKERKKYGQPGARKRFQFAKR